MVNADTGADIAMFNSSGSVSVKNTPNINVRANVIGVRSVKFTDATKTITENNPPYAYKSDFGGVYNKWAPLPGATYTFNATPYSGTGGTGTVGPTASFRLTVTNDDSPTAPPTAYDITSLELVNASNGVRIRTLQPNETISLSNLGAPSISIRAVAGTGARSVKFESAEASVSRVEANLPWSFLGDNGSAYTPWRPLVNKTYSITATGYSASGASGSAGKRLTVTINVTP